VVGARQAAVAGQGAALPLEMAGVMPRALVVEVARFPDWIMLGSAWTLNAGVFLAAILGIRLLPNVRVDVMPLKWVVLPNVRVDVMPLGVDVLPNVRADVMPLAPEVFPNVRVDVMRLGLDVLPNLRVDVMRAVPVVLLKVWAALVPFGFAGNPKALGR
jgi:hypothetical protein